MESPQETRPIKAISDDDEDNDNSPNAERLKSIRHMSVGIGGHDIDSIKAWRIHLIMEKYPRASFCFALSLFLLFLVITLILASKGILINFTTAVPMYLRDNRARINQDALTAGKLIATWKRPDGRAQSRSQEVIAETDLRLLFIRNDGGNILESKYLSAIERIENKILKSNGFNDVCLRTYTNDSSFACDRQNSITHLFDPLFFKGARNRTYDNFATKRNTFEFLRPSKFHLNDVNKFVMDYSSSNVREITSFWAEYGRGTPSSAAKGANLIWNNRTMPSQFEWMDSKGNKFALTNVMIQMTDSQWGVLPSDIKSRAVMTIFKFGLPLKKFGFESESDRNKDQNSMIGKWCFDEFQSPNAVFESYDEEFSEWNMRWNCGSMTDEYIQLKLQSDMALLFCTIAFIWLFMTFMTSSFWLSSWGMAMIFLNFGPALILYRFITQFKYFGTLNIMGMFIILAIGADDIFVIIDTWSQIRTVSPDFKISKRLTMTVKHAGKVMLTTSLSTIVSFAANATSSFPGVYTFGIFSAWLIFVNYCAVVLFYPCVLVVHDVYFHTYELKYPWCCWKCCETESKPACCFTGGCCNNVKSSSQKAKSLSARPIDKWFEEWLYVRVYNHRKKCLTFFGLIFLMFFYFATQIKADSNAPQMLPRGNNYQEYFSDIRTYFARTSNPEQITNNIYFGISGIDRNGIDYTVSDDLGKVIFDDKFSIIQPKEHEYLSQFCDDLMCGYDTKIDCRYSEWDQLKIIRPQANVLSPVQCPINAFRDWILTDAHAANLTYNEWILKVGLKNVTQKSLPFNISKVNSCKWREWPVSDNDCFLFLLTVWAYDDLPTSNPKYSPGFENYNFWKPHLFAESFLTSNGFEQTLLRFIVITAKLDSYSNSDFNDGILLFDVWGKYLQKWRDSVNGLVSRDQFNKPYIITPKSLLSVRHSHGYFSFYFVESRIIYEAFQGIILSLFCAWIIITMSTNNWFMALISTFTITVIVICVIGFTVLMGWNLGVIEAVIYVMVVGMSVDYVVHLSEAYLHAFESLRHDRTRRMLGIVGASVLSGAISTGGGIFILIFASINVFVKFGATIFFLVIISLLYSLIAFTSIMSLIGPQNDFGNFWNLCKGIYYGVRWGCCKKPFPKDLTLSQSSIDNTKNIYQNDSNSDDDEDSDHNDVQVEMQ